MLDYCVTVLTTLGISIAYPYLMLFIGVEFCWNVFPAVKHVLVGNVSFWTTPSEYPFMDNKTSTENKDK